MSNKIKSGIKVKDLDTVLPRQGRIQGEKGEVYNEVDLLGVGTSLVNGKPQGTVFGSDMVVSSERPELSGKWDLGINLSGSKVQINGSGYAEVEAGESLLKVHTGTDADGSIILTSKKRLRYEPGTPIFAKFTTNFPELADANGDYTVGIGLGE